MSNRPAPGSVPASGGAAAAAIAIDLDAAIAALRPARRGCWPSGWRPPSTEARAIEGRLPDPTLALAIADGTGLDEHVHIRGSHKNLGEVVPRRFLRGAGRARTRPPHEAGSGRLELARRMVDPAANRWCRGCWSTASGNIISAKGSSSRPTTSAPWGRSPAIPSCSTGWPASWSPGGWSIKAMHRLMVTSSTYRMSSAAGRRASGSTRRIAYLHRMNVRRLEAEAIRDALLAVSGRLEPAMYGPSVPVHLTSFMDGRGRPGRSGPLDGDGRRSLYLERPAQLPRIPMLLAFDAPVPFSTMGRRNVSNVPAQALHPDERPAGHRARPGSGPSAVLAAPGQSARERIRPACT